MSCCCGGGLGRPESWCGRGSRRRSVLVLREAEAAGGSNRFWIEGRRDEADDDESLRLICLKLPSSMWVARDSDSELVWADGYGVLGLDCEEEAYWALMPS